MAGRCWARVDIPAGRETSLPYTAFEGLPGGRQSQLPLPAVVVIDEQPEGGFLLLGYSSNREFSGDTWHPDLEGARAQAEFAYGAYLSEWRSIPDGTQDAVAYVLAQRDAG
jgi:hypothetical protein